MKGGNRPNEGFIEVKRSTFSTSDLEPQTWGGICDDNWDKKDADVVCRMLGYPSAQTVYTASSPFGHGTGSFILDNVECVGTETSVFDCPHNVEGKHDCGSSEWAGVKCTSSNLKKDSLLQNAFVSEEKRIIQKTVDLNKPLTKEMEKVISQQKGDFGEITEENHEKDKTKSDSVSKEGKILRSVLKVNFPYLVNL